MFGYSLVRTEEIKAYKRFFDDMKKFHETSKINWDKVKELNKLYDEGKISAKEYNERSSKLINSDYEQQKNGDVAHE